MDQKENNSGPKPNDFLANERTYLAWIRTGIGIMAFGFVVVKFSLFVKQIGLVLGTTINVQSRGYSASIGIVLVVIGVLSIVLSFSQYRKTDNQLKSGTYQPSTLLTTILTGIIVLISVVLIVYLMQSVN